MDKTKMNSVIVIVVLFIICIALLGYAANVNAQLGVEKAKTAGLNSRIVNLQNQLSGAISKADQQKSLADSLQASLNSLNIEVNNLRTVNADLDARLKAQADVSVLQDTIPVAQ